METNARFIAIAALIATLISPLTYAQNLTRSGDPVPPVEANAPQPDGPGPRHGKHRGGPDKLGRAQGPGPRGRMGGLTSLTTISGTVGQLVGNDDYILDGFTLNAGGVTTTVKFPSHLGQQVQQAIKPGSNVSVSGYSEPSRQGETRFRLNSLTAGKTTVFDTPPARSATPETPTLTSVTGKIADYRLNREGRVSGLVLDDKTVVTIPSHVAYQLTELAKKGNSITVQGYPRTVRDGQVQLEKVNILRASVLTINGQQYLVR
jgi:hypothetical protein